MNKEKTLVIMASLVLCIMTLVGCGKKETSLVADPNASTIGTKLLNVFIEESNDSQDVEEIASKIVENELISDLGMVTMPVEPGFLNGFDEEINGFNKGCMFAPMIGSIPFVGYIFESENPDELVESLKAHAMPNWNICTQADETVVEKSGNLVYFVMAPNSFD